MFISVSSFKLKVSLGFSNKSMDNPQDCPLIERSASSYTDDEEEKTDGMEDYEKIVCGFTGDDNP